MNGKVKCVKNQGKNSEWTHLNCKYVVTIMWNNYVRIKFTSTNNTRTCTCSVKFLG